ncbi:MAG TPA: hypothetical protein VNT92_01440 [Acidimicrobiia bacterium]|nr:hypothetical protein [Acidimicrobiia bacterium]
MSFGLRGLGLGLATAIGFPLALVSVLAAAGELVGFGTAMGWSHPVVAGLGFVLGGVGLHGLYKRLEISSTIVNATIWVGVALGLFGIADINSSGRFFGSYAIPAAFVLLTFGLVMMGLVALREKSFGVLSWVPLGVAVSVGVCFLSLFPWFGGGYNDVAQASALVVQVVGWLTLGAALASDPPGNAGSVPFANQK